MQKLLKVQQEAKELGISTSEVSSLAEIEAMVKAKKAEKAKPKTEAEKLEATRKEALEKLDFYERVVRSVAREEAEVAGYLSNMDEDIKTTEAIEEATPVVEPVQQYRGNIDENKLMLTALLGLLLVGFICLCRRKRR